MVKKMNKNLNEMVDEIFEQEGLVTAHNKNLF